MSEQRTMRERLAALEHLQWAHWTTYMLDNLTPENIDRWRRQVATPYSELSEGEKNSDRQWADKVLHRLREPDVVRKVAVALLANDEREDERETHLLEWAEQALYGKGTKEHLPGCPTCACTCPACERENYEASARAAIDAIRGEEG